MNKEKRRVPKLRFPGFTEDWEQRKFGEIYERAGQKNDLTYGIDKIISVANMYFKKDVIVGSEEYLKTYNVFKLGDIAFEGHTNKEYRYGRFVENTIGDGIVSHIFDVFTPKINLDINFWKDLIKYEPIMGPILRRCTKASRMMSNLTTKEFLEEQILCPTLEEQKLIGEFIVSLDKNITLHQRKLEHLNLKKKALLQKLFPKNGERYPELRFPGFTDAWEQRKADYIFKSVTDKGYPELPVLSASQELGMVYREQNGIDIQHNKKNEASYKRVLPGQFVIHLRSFQGGFAYSEVEGITSPAYTVMSFKNSNEQYGLFWKHIFKSEIFIKRLETITYGIRDGRSISFSDFKSLILQYPSFSEQKMIGDSIAIIERGITLHQRKLEHLQLQKKALLQQMFV